MQKNKEWVARLFQQQLEPIKTHAINLKNQPNEHEHVHQFRVRIRHLRSLLSFFEPELSKKWVKKTNAFLKKHASLFSNTREMDVILEYGREFEANNTQEKPIIPYVFEKASSIRLHAIEHFDVLGFNSSLEELFQKIPFKKEKKLKKKKTQKRLNAFTKQIIANKKAIDLQDYNTMHKYRKEVKKLRYLVTSTTQFLNHDILNLQSIKKLSEELGVLTDVFFIRNTVCSFENIEENEILGFLNFLHDKEQKAFETCIDLLQKKEIKQ